MNIYKVGKIVKGTVTGIENYGAFVSLENDYTGLIHISEISYGYVKDISNYLKIGDIIYVEILDVDDELLHLKLSIKNIKYNKKNKRKPKEIVETKTGFKTLSEKLPIWINEKMVEINQK